MYIVNNSKASASPRVISGRSLVHQRLNARQKAAIAASVLAGEAVIKLSARQVAAVLGTHATYIRAASQLSPEMRRSIVDGRDQISFTGLLKPSSKPLALPKPVSDEQLAGIVRGAGIDRVLAVACEVESAAA